MWFATVPEVSTSRSAISSLVSPSAMQTAISCWRRVSFASSSPACCRPRSSASAVQLLDQLGPVQHQADPASHGRQEARGRVR